MFESKSGNNKSKARNYKSSEVS